MFTDAIAAQIKALAIRTSCVSNCLLALVHIDRVVDNVHYPDCLCSCLYCCSSPCYAMQSMCTLGPPNTRRKSCADLQSQRLLKWQVCAMRCMCAFACPSQLPAWLLYFTGGVLQRLRSAAMMRLRCIADVNQQAHRLWLAYLWTTYSAGNALPLLPGAFGCPLYIQSFHKKTRHPARNLENQPQVWETGGSFRC